MRYVVLSLLGLVGLSLSLGVSPGGEWQEPMPRSMAVSAEPGLQGGIAPLIEVNGQTPVASRAGLRLRHPQLAMGPALEPNGRARLALASSRSAQELQGGFGSILEPNGRC